MKVEEMFIIVYVKMKQLFSGSDDNTLKVMGKYIVKGITRLRL